MLNLAIICGGPSKERGISLNSARSFLDHTYPLELELTVLYVNPEGKYFQLTPAQLYSNTPSDFDFKLPQTSLSLNEKQLIALLKTVDLVFPLIHGVYGEDGTLQGFLEDHQIPFVGSPSHVCMECFNKHKARQLLTRNHFPVLPSLLVHSKDIHLDAFWNENDLSSVIVKPTQSGSSIGVRYAHNIDEARRAIIDLLGNGFHELIVEPYCKDAEFTICVLESHCGSPVSLIPMEIDIGNEQNAILDYRRKYLPSDQTRYYCPPRFDQAIIQKIRTDAERLFKAFGLRDFARIDGWVSKDGTIRFSDLNPISGMEQNSFIFQQASRVRLSHTDLIQYILETALRRHSKFSLISRRITEDRDRSPVYVLMGGTSSERHVSLMSGSNVWLKLMHDPRYQSIPFLLEQNETVWQLPYSFALHHTVEETAEHCQNAEKIVHQVLPIAQEIHRRLGFESLESLELPVKMNLNSFIMIAKQNQAFVLIALHGGVGEDGTLQKRFEDEEIAFNGSGSVASALCMDKHLTAKCIGELNDPNILPMQQLSFEPPTFFRKPLPDGSEMWRHATAKFSTHDLIVKPQCDGCSTGVVRLKSMQELSIYLAYLQKGARQVQPGTFYHQNSILQMPSSAKTPFLLEPYIKTDKIEVNGSQLIYEFVSGWCEMTVGVLENEGIYFALPPSITVAENHVLSVEEKFQGGTGINITPPPEHLFPTTSMELMQKSVCKAAQAIGIKNYARFDLFVELQTGRVRVIEVNTLPALTPSTVLYHQALSSTPSISPRELLVNIIESAQNAGIKLC